MFMLDSHIYLKFTYLYSAMLQYIASHLILHVLYTTYTHTRIHIDVYTIHMCICMYIYIYIYVGDNKLYYVALQYIPNVFCINTYYQCYA